MSVYKNGQKTDGRYLFDKSSSVKVNAYKIARLIKGTKIVSVTPKVKVVTRGGDDGGGDDGGDDEGEELPEEDWDDDMDWPDDIDDETGDPPTDFWVPNEEGWTYLGEFEDGSGLYYMESEINGNLFGLDTDGDGNVDRIWVPDVATVEGPTPPPDPEPTQDPIDDDPVEPGIDDEIEEEDMCEECHHEPCICEVIEEIPEKTPCEKLEELLEKNPKLREILDDLKTKTGGNVEVGYTLTQIPGGEPTPKMFEGQAGSAFVDISFSVDSEVLAVAHCHYDGTSSMFTMNDIYGLYEFATSEQIDYETFAFTMVNPGGEVYHLAITDFSQFIGWGDIVFWGPNIRATYDKFGGKVNERNSSATNEANFITFIKNYKVGDSGNSGLALYKKNSYGNFQPMGLSWNNMAGFTSCGSF